MERFYRKPRSITAKKDLKLQCVEWHTSDFAEDPEDPEEYTIRCFGVTEEGYSVCCSITEFKPFFYIKVPGYFTKSHMFDYISKIKQKKVQGKNVINYYVKDSLIMNKCEIIEAKDFYGFHNGDKFKFIKMVFNNQKGMRGYLYGIKNLDKSMLYETNIDPLLKFYHIMNIQPSNWINVSKFVIDDEVSTCQINIKCKYDAISHHSREGNAPLLQASYDIETYSKPYIDQDTGKENYPFPVPEKESNVVYQIATCFKTLGTDKFLVKHLLTLKKCSNIDDKDVVVWECEDERDLLLKWKRLIELMDPDILYQYNGDIFDCQYMVSRAKLLGIQFEFLGVSRLLDTPATLVEKTFSSSAYGTTNYKRLSIPGRINFDILIFIKREYKENSYKLDNISEKYLGEKKNEVSVIDIFKAYETGDPDAIKRIGRYCIQDTLLPQKLVDTLHILQTQISMSNVTFVPIRYLIEKGQEIKALSQISKNTQNKGFLLPHFEYDTESVSFEGATVLPVDNPSIYNVPVTVLDFASLYPSIIRAHNLCYTSIVLNKEYANLPGVEYLTVEFSGSDETDPYDVVYAKNTETILPDLLAELGIQRKKFKKLMAKEEDPLIREIYNKNQLAYKVSMNSIYGILGSRTIGCKSIAATVTKIGRDMIKETKNYIENNHHCVLPEGHQTQDLDENKHVTIKSQSMGERSILVKDLVNMSEDIMIKTSNGWRKFLGLEPCV